MQNLTADSPIEAAGVSISRLYKPVIYEEPPVSTLSGGSVLFWEFKYYTIVHNQYSSRQHYTLSHIAVSECCHQHRHSSAIIG